MSEVVRPEGWNNWKKPEAEKTARYAEYGNTGLGAGPNGRVDWARQLTPEEAKLLTRDALLQGQDHWRP